jgi:hypothetical protein
LRYGHNCATKADVPAAPAANRNGSNGKQQLDAAITLPNAARRAPTVLSIRIYSLPGFVLFEASC